MKRLVQHPLLTLALLTLITAFSDLVQTGDTPASDTPSPPNPASVLSAVGQIFTAPTSENGVSAILPAVTGVPCCNAGCPLGLCSIPVTSSQTTTSGPPGPSGHPGSQHPFPPFPFPTQRACILCDPGFCGNGCCTGNCGARRAYPIGPCATPQPLPADCPTGNCECGGPCNCKAPETVPPQLKLKHTNTPLPPGCVPGDCNCGPPGNCAARSLTVPITLPTAGATASPSFVQPQDPASTITTKLCLPGDCDCGGLLNCGGELLPPWTRTVPPSGHASTETFRGTPRASGAGSSPVYPDADPNYIPIIAQSRTSPPEPVIIYAKVALDITENIMSRPVIESLHRAHEIVNYAQANDSTVKFPSTISLNLIAGVHGILFPEVVFNVWEDAPTTYEMPVVIVGTDFLRTAFALRLTDEYMDVVGSQGQLTVLVDRPPKEEGRTEEAADWVKDEL